MTKRAAEKRVYVVTDAEANKERLVNAANGAQARAHCTRNRFPVELAGQHTIARLIKAGVEIEECSGKDDTP